MKILFMVRYVALLAVGCTLIGIQGCASSVGTSDPLKYGGRYNTTAAHALFPDEFETIDLADALDPNKMRNKTETGHVAADNIEGAMRAFYDASYTTDAAERRNRLQDRLLAASEQRCGIFKHYLRRVDSMNAIYTGITTTVLGGAGAIAQSIRGAQTLSALSAISSGVGAELKQVLFANLTADVITTGIEERRKELRRVIQLRRG